MRETQASISQWAAETFGEPTIIRLAARANEEMAELLTAVARDASLFDIAIEAADVRIVLYRLQDLCSLELNEDPEFSLAMRVHLARDHTVQQIALQANVWLSQLLLEVVRGLPEPKLLARTLDALYALPRKSRWDLDSMVDDKMAINRARKWGPKGEGVSQHIEDEDAGSA